MIIKKGRNERKDATEQICKEWLTQPFINIIRTI